MFARVAVLIACLHLVAANYRTCKCSIRTGGSANAPLLLSWSKQLRSTCWGCGFPGLHVSCNEVKSWCPNNCYNQAEQEVMFNQGDLDKMCTSRAAATSGLPLFVHSQVMSNCGSTWIHHSLPSKLCCTYSAASYRWLGKKC